MKTVSKPFIPGIFANSINRNLTLMLLLGFTIAVTLVTVGVILINSVIGR